MKDGRTKTLPIALGAVVLSCVILSVLFALFGCGAKDKGAKDGAANDPEAPEVTEDTPPTYGVFIPSVYNLAFPSKPDLPADELRTEIDAIVEGASEIGLDALYFQVRPECDALYASNIFPVSKYLSSDGTLTLDCLEYMVSAAHAKGIAVTAWINPFRVTVNKATLSDLPVSSPAATTLYDDVVSYGGKLYFDPASPAVRRLICDGVAEIVENYDVDGIIFDDYFYPYVVYETDADGNSIAAAFDDAKSFAASGGTSLADFRRENVNALIKDVYLTVKDARASCRFGVAPFGIWKNDDGSNGGSMTSGLESYSELFCDTLAWVEGGYVDYIAPQIYWRCDSLTASFKVLAAWWEKKLERSSVDLLISHAAYCYGDGSFDAGELTKQLDAASRNDHYRGSIFYSWAAFRDDLSGICTEITRYISDTVSN